MDDASYRGEVRDAERNPAAKQRDHQRSTKMSGKLAHKPHLRKKKPIPARGMCERRKRRY